MPGSIQGWGNKIAQDIWETGTSSKIPREIHKRAKFLLTVMDATTTTTDLCTQGEPPKLRLHKLKGEWKGYLAIDIATKVCPWRIVFVFDGGRFYDVQIIDYH